MRTRQIHRDFWASEDVAKVGFFERLVFAGLWGMADRAGLVLNRPARIRAELFPYDDITHAKIAKAIETLSLATLIRIIETPDDVITCIYIPNFLKYQHIHPNEAKSALACKYIPGNYVECTPASASTSASTSTSAYPPTPRKRGAGARDDSRSSGPDPDVIAVIDHLNRVTGKSHSHDKGNTQIEGALKRGATVADCCRVIDHLWATWSPEWRQRINKITPFRKANFDGYLDEAAAGGCRQDDTQPERQADPEFVRRWNEIVANKPQEAIGNA